jgi:ribosomal protein S18 acetylase RimI-like enzyme
MTLGVIDEFRKKGVGKLLIESILEVGNEWKSVKLVYLHVISYNKAAINFYKKNAFTILESL